MQEDCLSLSPTARYVIAVALSQGATISVYQADLLQDEVDALSGLLSGLASLGHIAAFSVAIAGPPMNGTGVIEVLRRDWDFVLEALVTSAPAPAEPAPSYLMPVWAFDHELEGLPASTARFLHLELQVIATRTTDEEVGVPLPGRCGAWLVHARPILF